MGREISVSLIEFRAYTVHMINDVKDSDGSPHHLSDSSNMVHPTIFYL